MAEDDLVRPELDELILGGHVVYESYPVHFVGEFARIQHTDGDQDYVTMGGFAEAGYTIKKVTPYARFELVAFPDAADPDPFFAIDVDGDGLPDANSDFWSVRGGLKWTTSEKIALKIEYALRDENGATTHVAATQCAFAF